MANDKTDGCLGCLVLTVLTAVVLFLLGGWLEVNFGGQQYLTGTVKRCYVEKAYYVEFKADDGQVHVLTDIDSLVWWKWDSADVYAGLKEGHRYRVHTVGYRVPLFSWFPNILDVQEEPDQGPTAQKLGTEVRP